MEHLLYVRHFIYLPILTTATKNRYIFSIVQRGGQGSEARDVVMLGTAQLQLPDPGLFLLHLGDGVS